jgi:hypothetical protein
MPVSCDTKAIPPRPAARASLAAKQAESPFLEVASHGLVAHTDCVGFDQSLQDIATIVRMSSRCADAQAVVNVETAMIPESPSLGLWSGPGA